MKRVLVVNGDIEQCLALSDFLGEFGFETAVASDREKMFRELEAADPLPDAILLDLEMPNSEGWKIREELIAHPKYKSISLIVISSDDDLIQPFQTPNMDSVLLGALN